jgi:hypothetical protein
MLTSGTAQGTALVLDCACRADTAKRTDMNCLITHYQHVQQQQQQHSSSNLKGAVAPHIDMSYTDADTHQVLSCTLADRTPHTHVTRESTHYSSSSMRVSCSSSNNNQHLVPFFQLMTAFTLSTACDEPPILPTSDTVVGYAHVHVHMLFACVHVHMLVVCVCVCCKLRYTSGFALHFIEGT